ncbi:hypothetical protein [Streptomyces sp. SID3343]|uniref:hypothetical protein n=1 Tax=Streptomyces sp. SID3343 TaxID=2690260 RepID=UPI00136CD5EF|nr:hypothetical protein [Streptomyces sp. SID3343]MYV98461.1 hypothetical protein [Streptomyces sp. SID3343]
MRPHEEELRAAMRECAAALTPPADIMAEFRVRSARSTRRYRALFRASCLLIGVSVAGGAMTLALSLP